ncbi:MAG TPA: high frequency lysogenization protein HflD [Gammaproteobacteria bacterium]|nr:high frequency lysogenization protein HflD [Gammaproteobacteria bacterium]
MQDKQLYNITIALAGVAQAASLVKELAQTGKLDDDAYQTSIYSIFQTDAPDLPAVYGGLEKIKFGLEKLILMLDPPTLLVQTRYMLSLMRLQKKITRSSKMMRLLSKRLDQTKKQVEYFSLLHPTVITNLADIYLNIISLFRFRIIVWGNQRILIAPENMKKIRALLLAGVRSSVLWRQMGGSRFQLIFSRAKIRDMAKKILTELGQ